MKLWKGKVALWSNKGGFSQYSHDPTMSDVGDCNLAANLSSHWIINK